jgi:hypothetical protein
MKRRCNCVQGPKLKPTGWSGDHPEWYCPVCKKEYYVERDGSLTGERPFKWPTKNPSNAWHIVDDDNPDWQLVAD